MYINALIQAFRIFGGVYYSYLLLQKYLMMNKVSMAFVKEKKYLKTEKTLKISFLFR